MKAHLCRIENYSLKNKNMKSKLLKVLSAIILILIPAINFGQAPALGTAANFVLFSSNGAVSNTGLSQLTGNVGTNNGSSTAFGNVNGGMHDGDGVSAQCASDLLIAYNFINSMVPSFFPSPLLGNGDTLVSGVYSINGASTLNLDLTLDAEGDANAVFVFQIQGSLSTNANAKVNLINGALACNVFWKVEGAINMASETTMRGTLIANNGAIEMSVNDTLEGRALSTTGAITIDGTLAYTPIGCGSPVLSGPNAPAIGSAECYALFSSNGSVVNAGITYAVGDVGTNVGLTTGFNSLNVTGTIHPIPDPSTAQCGADLLIAYNYLNNLSVDIELLHPDQFGNNLVLTPHSYIMNSAVTFTDTVYLNAQGNANAVFVIKTYGAFSTSVGSKVILINGTQAKNVYWMVNGAVTINNYSEFNGSLICYGAVDLLQGAAINGRVLTVDGALNTNAVNITMPAGCSAGAPDISTQPNNQTACDGNSVSFSVIAHGANLTYQWKKGTTNIINGGNISGANSAILTIYPASLADAGTTYNVVVSGSVAPDQTSINASLSINSAPGIVTAPGNQNECVGNSAGFSVTATGSGLTYQWRKGTVNLINSGNISGANSSSLLINPVNTSDFSATYNVIISGSCSPSITSANAELSLCQTTGMDNFTDGNIKVLGMFPNPFTNHLTIQLNDAVLNHQSEMRMYNVLGTLMLKKALTTKVAILETNNLPSGIYFYKIIENNKIVQTGKLISQQ